LNPHSARSRSVSISALFRSFFVGGLMMMIVDGAFSIQPPPVRNVRSLLPYGRLPVSFHFIIGRSDRPKKGRTNCVFDVAASVVHCGDACSSGRRRVFFFSLRFANFIEPWDSFILALDFWVESWMRQWANDGRNPAVTRCTRLSGLGIIIIGASG
jgi:hypothetical protein